MAFLPNGTWLPDNIAQQSAQPQMQMQPQGLVQSQGLPQIQMAQMPINNPMVQQQPMIAAQNQIPLMQTMQGQGNQGLSSMQHFMPASSMQMSQVNPAMTAIMKAQQPHEPVSMPNNMNPVHTLPAQFQMPQMQQPMYQQQPMPQQHSVMQSVNNANPQSVSNFLQALHQSNMGGSNSWQNAPGAQGKGPQAGFQGFGQQQQPQYQPTQWQQSGSNQGPQLGSYANKATQSQGIQAGGVSAGGTGGTKNQPITAQGTVTNSNSDLPVAQAVSDINTKHQIQSGTPELQEFLDSLGVYSYEYKDPKYGDGRRISPMAQEIEQTPLGKIAISTNHEGYKQVDYGKLGGTMLASLALLNHKYNKLESELKQAVMQGLKDKGKR